MLVSPVYILLKLYKNRWYILFLIFYAPIRRKFGVKSGSEDTVPVIVPVTVSEPDIIVFPLTSNVAFGAVVLLIAARLFVLSRYKIYPTPAKPGVLEM